MGFLKSIADNLFKILLYVIAILVIAFAIFYSIKWYDHANTISETYGTSEIEDSFETVDIADIELSSEIVFYSTEQTRSYQKTINDGAEFDGAENTYNLLLNSTPADRVVTSSKNLDATQQILIYGHQNEQLAIISLNIQIQFYKNETVLTISTVADDTTFGYLQSYIRTNGFRLQVIQGGYERNDIEFYYSLNLANITIPEKVELTNGVVNPDIEITYGEVTLVEGIDYIVQLEDNTKLGTGVATITGIGNYTGTVTKTFMITGTEVIELNKNYIAVDGVFYLDDVTLPSYTVIDGNKVTRYMGKITSIKVLAFPTDELTNESYFEWIDETSFRINPNLVNQFYIQTITITFPGSVTESNLPLTGKPPSTVELLSEPTEVHIDNTEQIISIEGLKANASTIQITGTITLGDDTIEIHANKGQQRVITVDGVNITVAIYCFADDELTVLVNSADSSRLKNIIITLTSVVAYQ